MHACVRVCACDNGVVPTSGVWDVMTNEEVLEFVRKRIAQKLKLVQVCR